MTRNLQISVKPTKYSNTSSGRCYDRSSWVGVSHSAARITAEQLLVASKREEVGGFIELQVKGNELSKERHEGGERKQKEVRCL